MAAEGVNPIGFVGRQLPLMTSAPSTFIAALGSWDNDSLLDRNGVNTDRPVSIGA